MINKISAVKVATVTKIAAENLRALSAENQELREKLSFFLKKDHAERIASEMEEKGLESELSFGEKVSGLMNRSNLDVIEEAVGMSAPQMKIATVTDRFLSADGSASGSQTAAEANFLANLASL